MIESEEIIKKAVALFGRSLQSIVAMEELSELIKEVSKQLRGEGKRENLIEEVADVYIILEQIKIMYAIDENELKDEMDFKILRLNRKILGIDDE